MPNRGLNNLPELKMFRRALRNHLTPAEARLWTYLKGSQFHGRKFRRQHSFGGYILDFYCPSEHLAIELDGTPHFAAEAVEYDRERDAFMKQFDVLVLRYINRWVFDNPEGVLGDIRAHFGWRQKEEAAKAAIKRYPLPPQSGVLPLDRGRAY